ncbi:MAG: 50S ribosomal protein L11 methyltransferase [bacterium]
MDEELYFSLIDEYLASERSVGVIILNPDKRVLTINSAVETLLGVTMAEAVGCRCDELLQCDIFSSAYPFESVFSEGRTITEEVVLSTRARSDCLKGTWLDVGSGSGVLAVACGHLGAERVVACDIDYRAAVATVTNVRANGQERRILTFCGSTEAVRGPFDGIVANLPISVLAAIWNSFTRLLAPEGVLILSGCREPEGEWLASSLAPQGLALRKVATRHETALELPPSGSFTWAGLSLERCP